MLKENLIPEIVAVETNVPEMVHKFDPWHLFFDTNEYLVEDHFTESVLKCTSMPSYMPPLSLLKLSLSEDETDSGLLRTLPSGKIISNPTEICQVLAFLTHSNWSKSRPQDIIDGSGKKLIIGYVDRSISVTAEMDPYLRKWRLNSQGLSAWDKPIDLLVFKISRGNFPDLGVRHN